MAGSYIRQMRNVVCQGSSMLERTDLAWVKIRRTSADFATFRFGSLPCPYPKRRAQDLTRHHHKAFLVTSWRSNFGFTSHSIHLAPNFTFSTTTWTLKMYQDEQKSPSPPLLLVLLALHSVPHLRCLQSSCHLEDSASRSLTTTSLVSVCGSSLLSRPC